MTNDRSRLNVKKESKFPSLLGALLSYVVPGLGQIYQGRIAKGVLFLVTLYGLFFYGLYLGQWQNVYIYADPNPHDEPRPLSLSELGQRLSFFGQAWIGAAAWPAVWQHLTYDPNPDVKSHPVLGKFERRPSLEDRRSMLRDFDKRLDVGWLYTMIAGVLNILVIYDAYAGPIVLPADEDEKKEKAEEAKKDSEE